MDTMAEDWRSSAKMRSSTQVKSSSRFRSSTQVKSSGWKGNSESPEKLLTLSGRSESPASDASAELPATVVATESIQLSHIRAATPASNEHQRSKAALQQRSNAATPMSPNMNGFTSDVDARNSRPGSRAKEAICQKQDSHRYKSPGKALTQVAPGEITPCSPVSLKADVEAKPPGEHPAPLSPASSTGSGDAARCKVLNEDDETDLLPRLGEHSDTPPEVPAKHDNPQKQKPPPPIGKKAEKKPVQLRKSPGSPLSPLSKDAVKCHVRGITKSLLCNSVMMMVYITATYCYTLAGGVILVALDAQYYADLAQTYATAVVEQGFNETQLEFLANHSIPPPIPSYTLFDGQQYALQLVTTIGYGNMGSHTTEARWFAVIFSFVGIILVGYMLVQMGPCMFQLMIDAMVVSAAIFCAVRFTPGQAELWAQQARTRYAFVDGEDTAPMSLWEVRQMMAEICKGHPPEWDVVCSVVADAGVTKSGLVCRTELENVMKVYAKHVAEEEQNERQSVFIFKGLVLLVWILGGALFYATHCPDISDDYGTNVYFALITLTTIGTGDFYPGAQICEAFWFFHTACGLGMMSVVTYLLGIRLQSMFQAARNQRVELSTEYGYTLRCRSLRRKFSHVSVFSHMVRGVAIIMAYVAIGGIVFSTFEAHADPLPPFLDVFDGQGFNSTQLDFIASFAPAGEVWNFVNGMSYSFESITTIGYGDFYLRTSGARTFAVFYILFGLGIVGLQLESLGQVSRFLLHLLCDAVISRVKWHGVSLKRDERMLSILNDLLDDLEQLATQPDGLTMADLQQHVEMTNAAPGIQTEMLGAMLGVSGMEVHLIHVDASCASVSLAQLYHRVMVRRGIGEFIGAVAVMVIIFLTSFPVFMYAESWSIGESAWFCYITTTTIGLGDFTPSSVLGLVWWYFLVFVTLGQISVFFPSMLVVWRGVVEPCLRRRRRRPLPPPPIENSSQLDSQIHGCSFRSNCNDLQISIGLDCDPIDVDGAEPPTTTKWGSRPHSPSPPSPKPDPENSRSASPSSPNTGLHSLARSASPGVHWDSRD